MGNVFDQFDGQHPQAQPQAQNPFDNFTPKTAYTSSILPVSKDTQGHLHWAVPGIVQDAISAATLPGDVYSGKTPINGPNGNINPEVIRRSADLAAIASPVSVASRAGEAVIPGVKSTIMRENAVVPTTKELQQAGVAAIRQGKASPLEIGPSAVSEWSRNFEQQLLRPTEGNAVHPTRMPETYKILQELQNAPAGGKFTPGDFQALRQTLQEIAQDFNSTNSDQLAATRAIKSLDNFLPSVAPKDVVAGAASAAPATNQQLVARALAGKREAANVSDLFKTGNANYAAAMRSNAITGDLTRARTGIEERSIGRGQAANSGRNLDAPMRSKVESLLEKPKEVAGLSDNEIAALKKFIKGGLGRNSARSIGNLFGGGGGYGRLAASGYGAGVGSLLGPTGAAVGMAAAPITGALLKGLENKIAKRELEGVASLMRQRSPLYAERLKSAGTYVPGLQAKSAIAKALLMNTLAGRNR